MPNVWIDEERMCLKLYEDCILNYKLNGCVVINLVWIWMSLFIVGAEKLAVIHFSLTVGSPLMDVGSPFIWTMWPLSWDFKLSARR